MSEGNGKSRETGNKTKKNKATTQNALDTTMRTQTYKQYMGTAQVAFAGE